MAQNKFTVCGLVFINGKALLVRHTYGVAKNRILLPGGYCSENELPTDAIAREIYEETSIKTTVKSLIATCFKPDEWLMIFLMNYISGEPKSDNHENNEVLLLSVEEALKRDDITNMSRVILNSVYENNYKELMPNNNYCYQDYTPETFKMFGV